MDISVLAMNLNLIGNYLNCVTGSFTELLQLSLIVSDIFLQSKAVLKYFHRPDNYHHNCSKLLDFSYGKNLLICFVKYTFDQFGVIQFDEKSNIKH